MATAPTSIEQVYLDVLGRAPDPRGLEYWQSQFGPTVDANELATFQSAAAPELANPLSNITSVADLYTNVLQRESDTPGQKYWESQFGPTIDANELATFKAAAVPELSGLLSQPAQVTQPANVATQIDPNSDLSNLYNEYFERAPDQGGYDYWMSQFGPTIDASERQIFDLAAQPEKYGITDVTSLYKNYMGRTDEEIAADPEGLKYWTDLFGPTISGEEFATFRSVAGQTEPGNVPTYLKVEDMYKDVLGKEATASDKAYWEGLLGKTVSQNELNEFKQAAQDQYEANYFENYFPVTKTRGMAQETTGLNNVGGQVSLSNILANIQGQYSPEVYTRSGGSYGAGRFLPYNAMTTGANTQNQNPDASLFAPASFEQYSQSLIDKSLDQAVAETMGVSGGSSGDFEAGAPSAWSNMTEQERGAWVQANPGKYVAGKMAAVALLPGGQFLATQQDPYMGMSLVEYGVGKASNAAMGGLLEPGKGAQVVTSSGNTVSNEAAMEAALQGDSDYYG
jgi:hypothetical protein